MNKDLTYNKKAYRIFLEFDELSSENCNNF